MNVPNQPQLQDYLPAIALPILVIASLTAPPFPGRGIIFASLIITADYLSLTSPWPANEAETRPTRYGLSSSWLLVLPVLEKLLLHVPEHEFWRVKAPLDGVTDKGRVNPGKPATSHYRSLVPPPWTWRKLCWAVSLASTPRGVGWNFASHRVRSDYEAIAQKKIGRLAFVGASLGKALCAYLALDAVLVFGQNLAVPDAWLWNWHTTQDILIAEFLMLVCTYAGMKLQFEALAAVSVGLGFSKPEDWPPLFGSLADCYTVSNVWGKFWQTYIRLPVLGFGNFIVQCLHVRKRSPMANFTILTVAFTISDFFHTVGLAIIRNENLTLRALTVNMSIFFMTQPLAASIEALVIDAYRRLTTAKTPSPIPKDKDSDSLKKRDNQQSQDDTQIVSPILRVMGYLWVFCWFSITGWGFTKAYIAVGVRDWQMPHSICHALLSDRKGQAS